MKRVVILLLIFMNSALVFGQEAEFSLEEKVHKFPKTKEGVLLEHEYKITNTGDAPLIISDYSVSCTCTKVYLPKEPILPGATYNLKVTFDTNGKFDFQDRTIYLKTNTKKETHAVSFKVRLIQ
ncbi:MAG: hypothetical protein DCO96_06725 [Fluviicola sp. XM-24bin1]|nr:MAG: hypothetical protein DCO96_06725 [Fluviicola sp. XM-24bin1]